MIKRKRNLQSLFKRIPIVPIGPVPSVRISGISIDSRKVQPGMLFAALKGENADGFDYIPQAVAAGAVAVMSDRPAPEGLPVPYVQVEGDAYQCLTCRWKAICTVQLLIWLRHCMISPRESCA